MVFIRLRLVVVATVMRAPGPTRKDGSWLRSSEIGPKDDEACSFDCIVSIFVWRQVEVRSGWPIRSCKDLSMV
jgi:hypothetical protein